MLEELINIEKKIGVLFDSICNLKIETQNLKDNRENLHKKLIDFLNSHNQKNLLELVEEKTGYITIKRVDMDVLYAGEVYIKYNLDPIGKGWGWDYVHIINIEDFKTKLENIIKEGD